MTESGRQELRETLRELHQELSAGVEVDPQLREELERAAAEIDEMLEQSGDETAGGTRLSDTAQRLALRLEVSHPTLTGVLNRITHQLASLGI